MPKHTPGPWRNHVTEGYPFGITSAHRFGDHDPEVICLIGGDTMTPLDETENEANAALITAAPDMLAALEFARGQIAEYLNGRLPIRFLDESLSKINAAIALANIEVG